MYVYVFYMPSSLSLAFGITNGNYCVDDAGMLATPIRLQQTTCSTISVYQRIWFTEAIDDAIVAVTREMGYLKS